MRRRSRAWTAAKLAAAVFTLEPPVVQRARPQLFPTWPLPRRTPVPVPTGAHVLFGIQSRPLVTAWGASRNQELLQRLADPRRDCDTPERLASTSDQGDSREFPRVLRRC